MSYVWKIEFSLEIRGTLFFEEFRKYKSNVHLYQLFGDWIDNKNKHVNGKQDNEAYIVI